MDDDSARKAAAAASFGENAEGYVSTDTHSQGEDLELLASWCAGARVAVDVATGAGHTAGALAEAGVETVVAADAAPEMLRTSLESYPGLQGVAVDAERLPFASDSVDAVTCRIAAHHFPDPEAFVAEVARVLAPGGVFALEDNVVPEDEALGTFFNRLERMRDPTHVESYTTATWHGWLEAAGLSVTATEHLMKPIAVEPWLDRMSALDADDKARVREFLRDASPAARDAFDLQYEDGDPESFGSLKAMIRAEAAE
jgi:ubiquinone/menaquinone biosynthesis C-methylase UbiE